MKKGWKFVAIVSMVLFVFLLCPMGGQAQAKSGAKKVYLLYPTLGFPFIVSLMDYSNKFAKEIGVDLTIFDGQMDDNKQYQQAMQAINDKVDLVVLCVLGQSGGTIMRKLQDARIPCVVLNQMPAKENDPFYTSAVIGDDYDHGVKCGQALMKKFGDKPCNIGVILGMAADTASDARFQGFKDTVTKKSNFKILAAQAADWDKGRAMSIAEDFLVKFEDKINAIYCGDDGMAAGAVQALKDADMGSGKVTVIGIGLNKQGIANIKDREQFGSAAHEPADFAKYCFSTVDKILKGQKVPKKVMVPGPWYDATNIDSYPYGEGTW